ncbi:MAG: hypothetical protein LBP91_02030 [Coriobacteriales bacterium]|jgi:hypothetical protein|nr:hypothetical protein [Coriobacteriales bacterium]
MARTNLAYKQEEQWQSYPAQPIRAPRPELKTIEGQGRGIRTRPQQAPWLNTLAAMSTVVLVVLATVSIARVSISNATVHKMQVAEQTSTSISHARTIGLELEVKHSLANNPTRIQDNAAARGILPSSRLSTLSARDGFSPETVALMSAAANEARAAELSVLQPSDQPLLLLESSESAPGLTPAVSLDDFIKSASDET